MSKIEYMRSMTCGGDMAIANAAAIGRSATSRKSRSSSTMPTPAAAPTHALRVDVRAG